MKVLSKLKQKRMSGLKTEQHGSRKNEPSDKSETKSSNIPNYFKDGPSTLLETKDVPSPFDVLKRMSPNGPKYEILYDQPNKNREYTNGHWLHTRTGDKLQVDNKYVVFPTRLLMDIPEVRDENGRVIAPAMKAGDMGPWVSGPDNISQYGTCFGNSASMIVGDARIEDDVRLIKSELQGNNGPTVYGDYEMPDCGRTLVISGSSLIKDSHLMGEYQIHNSYINDVDALYNFATVMDNSRDFDKEKQSQICNSIVEHADIDGCQIHDSRINMLNYDCDGFYDGHTPSSSARWSPEYRFWPGPVDIRNSQINSVVLFGGKKDGVDIPAVVVNSNIRHSEFVNCRIKKSTVKNSGYGIVRNKNDIHDKHAFKHALSRTELERMKSTVPSTTIVNSHVADFKISPQRVGKFKSFDTLTHQEVLIKNDVVKKSGKPRSLPNGAPDTNFIEAPFDFSNDSDFGD